MLGGEYMEVIEAEATDEPPLGQAMIVYQGPVSPHWDIQAVYGDADCMNAFRDRVHARLMLLPPHDPQFRRNRERVMRDAERERIDVRWDLGYLEDEAQDHGEPGDRSDSTDQQSPA